MASIYYDPEQLSTGIVHLYVDGQNSFDLYQTAKGWELVNYYGGQVPPELATTVNQLVGPIAGVSGPGSETVTKLTTPDSGGFGIFDVIDKVVDPLVPDNLSGAAMLFASLFGAPLASELGLTGATAGSAATTPTAGAIESALGQTELGLAGQTVAPTTTGGGMWDWLDAIINGDTTALGEAENLAGANIAAGADPLPSWMSGWTPSPDGTYWTDTSGFQLPASAVQTLTKALTSTAGSAAAPSATSLIDRALSLGSNSLLPAILGAVLGATQNKPAPIEQSTQPWNAEQFGPLMASAQSLAGNNPLQQPGIPALSGLPDLATDAHVQAAINAAINPMRHNFFDPGGTLSRVRTEFGDQYGSSRHQLATGIAAGRQAEAEGNIGAQIVNALYPINLAYNKDRALNADANKMWTFGQQTSQADKAFTAPWTNLTNLASILTGAAGRGTVSTTALPSSPWWQTALGGAATATDLWSKFFPKTATATA